MHFSAALGHLRAISQGSHLHEISEFVDAIPGEFIVDVEDFIEICDEVCMSVVIVAIVTAAVNSLYISEM